MKMENLKNCFKGAIETGSKYVAIVVETKGSKGPEVIVNPKENFENKLEYCMNAYDDNLVLKSYNGIKIIAFTHADSYDEIEKALLG